MTERDLRLLLGFFENELTNNILPFWFPTCVDSVYGGFLNCYTNAGDQLVSSDKYTWSQGRFVWVLSRLSTMERVFSSEQRNWFLAQAKQGCDFLKEHALIESTWNCVFLLDASGQPKLAVGCDTLDASIFADCFVAAGFAEYAAVSGEKQAWLFAKDLYKSIIERMEANRFNSLPYPLSSQWRMHSIPMIATNLACTMVRAMRVIEPGQPCGFLADVERFSSDVLENFIDENNCLHEIISTDGCFVGGTLGQHVNPGHVVEDMWFQIEAMDITGKPERLEQIARIADKALTIGWDDQCGGYFHFTNPNGGELIEDCSVGSGEPMLKQALGDWGSKLWWVHAEALYGALLLFKRTGESRFATHFLRTFDYTFRAFPNPDRSIREWRQILTREGNNQNKVVALPVKDPYHITRSLILLIELIEGMLDKQG